MQREKLLACPDLQPLKTDTIHSVRSRLFERALCFSKSASKFRCDAKNTMGEIDLSFRGVILPEDRRKLVFNYVSGAELIRHVINLIHENDDLSLYPVDLYSALIGCGVNMIVLADTVVDEQRPSPELLDEFYDACFTCVENPDLLSTFSFPDEEKYKKARAALIFASFTGRALQKIGSWAEGAGKIEEYSESRNRFFQSAEILLDSDKTGYLLRHDPYLTGEEYEYIGKGISNHIVTAGLAIVIPLTEKAREMKSALLEIWERAQKVFTINTLDDVEDLKRDLPWDITLTAFLTEDERYKEERDEVLNLIDDLRRIDSVGLNRESESEIERKKERIIQILWQTGVLPEILNRCKNPKQYVTLVRESLDRLNKIKGFRKSKREVFLVLSSLSILQILASYHMESNIKRQRN